MTNKSTGTFYERKLVNELKKDPNCIEVRRTPSSLGVFDIWALMKDGLHLIQVKSTKSQLQFEALKEKIKKLVLPPFCVKEVYVWYSYRPTRVNKRKENYKGWRKWVIEG